MSAVVASVFLLVAIVGGQTALGQLTGTIIDSSNTPLPGVTVTIDGPERRTVVTDSRGQFRITSLLPGEYVVRAALTGFVPFESKATVTRNGTTRVSLQLRVGALEEAITVSRETPILDVQSSKQQTTVSKEVLSAIPRSMNATGIAAGGGLAGAVAGGMHGGRGSDVLGRSAGPFNTEGYDRVEENGLRRVADEPLSTFSIDVDTASYANVRRFLTEGHLPPAGAVRIEELINYFHFDYRRPDAHTPFSVTTELAECPWNPKHRLALIGIQAGELADREPAPRNLVFLLDVSGSMMPPDKLPLVRRAMRLLVDILQPQDRVAIVVYAGASGLVLPSTPGDRKETIHRAIEQLEAGGSTNGAAGIRLAYEVARRHFIPGGVNRVILATDGDFNVGVTSQDELVRLIEQERASGIFLSVLGVGTGNLKDSTMEEFADEGNGNYAHLDSLQEARKVLVHEAGATLVTVAKDVKIQVEFNPKAVAAYRLIGYENRVLRNEDVNDDRKDAGEIGQGHAVTALYEIVPAGSDVGTAAVDRLRYQQPPQPRRGVDAAELATVKVRFKAPDGDVSRLMTSVLLNKPGVMSSNLGFASAVAEFGMLLTRSDYRGRASYASAVQRARLFQGVDREGYRAEFVKLVGLAAGLADRADAP